MDTCEDRGKRLIQDPAYRRAYLRERGLPDMSEWWRWELQKEIKAVKGKLPTNKKLFNKGKNQAKEEMADWMGEGESLQGVARHRLEETIRTKLPDSFGRWWVCPNKCRLGDSVEDGDTGESVMFSNRRQTSPVCPECGALRQDVSVDAVIKMTDFDEDNPDPWGMGYVSFLVGCAKGPSLAST